MTPLHYVFQLHDWFQVLCKPVVGELRHLRDALWRGEEDAGKLLEPLLLCQVRQHALVQLNRVCILL